MLGSRYVAGGGVRNWGPARRLISRGGCWYARRVLGVEVRDLTGGFKCFRREVLEAIDLDAVRSQGYAFQVEMTYRALQLRVPGRRGADRVRGPARRREQDVAAHRARGDLDGARLRVSRSMPEKRLAPGRAPVRNDQVT